jgi:A/G-specific adenine glycosylase
MLIKKLTSSQIKKFQKLIYTYYKNNRRDFAWRNTTNPYHIVVSEIMLQQTQTKRVEQKYPEFIKKFPTWKALATAPQSEVLRVWQGMGYNRRALALHQIAKEITTKHQTKLPSDQTTLQAFKGIGPNTAGSIGAFAFNLPTLFIETNIRSVYIHQFFPKKKTIHDKELVPLLEQTLDKKNPREWYYALMDYGIHLKKLYPNPSRRSQHHTKQSKFEGSDRQIRGAILRYLLKTPSCTEEKLQNNFSTTDKQSFQNILQELVEEKFITKTKNQKIKLI